MQGFLSCNVSSILIARHKVQPLSQGMEIALRLGIGLPPTSFLLLWSINKHCKHCNEPTRLQVLVQCTYDDALELMTQSGGTHFSVPGSQKDKSGKGLHIQTSGYSYNERCNPLVSTGLWRTHQQIECVLRSEDIEESTTGILIWRVQGSMRC